MTNSSSRITPARATSADTAFGDVIIRRASPVDAGAIWELFSTTYRNSSHPFQTVQDVSSFLADSRNFQIVAEHQERLVSSMAMTYYPWNNSYELGRAITCPDYRRQGLAAALMQGVVDQISEFSLGDVFFGFPRVRRIVDLCKDLDPSMIISGHDAGRNMVNGKREVHLIAYCIARNARFLHVSPQTREAVHSRYIQERIHAGLGLSNAPGEYPRACLVGQPSMKSARFGSLIFECDTALPGLPLEILGLSGAGATAQICREIDLLAEALSYVQHITATILADKTELIRELCTIGFEITAYLPAWYVLKGSRYDCVQLVRRAYDGKPAAQGFQEILDDLETELAALTGSLCRVSRLGNAA